MKKLLSFVMSLMLLVQTVPVAAIAEGTDGLVTATELTAALSLVGNVDDEEASWHKGMMPSETMNVLQLIEFLDDALAHRVHTLENYYTDIENELETLKKEDPAAYSALTTGENAGMAEYVHSLSREMEGARMKLEYWRNNLEYQHNAILSNRDLLALPSEITDYEQRLSSFRIREAMEEIRSIRTEMTQEAASCIELMDLQIGMMAGTENNADAYSARLSEWVQAVLSQRKALIASRTVSTASLFPTRKTLLGHLSPLSTAEADSSQEATIHVLGDKEMGIKVKDKEGSILSDVNISVRDASEEALEKHEQRGIRPTERFGTTSEDEGLFIYSYNGFYVEDDKLFISAILSKEGYKTIHTKYRYLKKGSVITEKMERDKGDAPYVSGCFFDGRDCLHSFYTALYTPVNSYENKITVHVVNPTDSKYVVHLIYQDAVSGQRYHTMGLSNDYGQETDNRVIPPRSEADLVTQARWRGSLKPGGDYFTMRIDGKDVPEKPEKEERNKKYCLRLVLEKDGEAQNGWAKGSPSLSTGNYIQVNTGLQVEKAKLQKPVFKAGNLTNLLKNTGGFSFSYPFKNEEFFTEASINFKIPLEEYIPRINIALDGTFAATIGYLPDKDLFNSANFEKWDKDDINQAAYSASKDIIKNWEKSWKKREDIVSNAKRKGGLSIKKSRGDLAVYGGIIYRSTYDPVSEKWTSRDLSIVVGVTIGYSYTKVWQKVTYYVPWFYGVTFSASAGIGFQLGGQLWINHAGDLSEEVIDRKMSYSPVYVGASLNINLMGTIFGGLGVKDIASISINGYAYINLLVEGTLRHKAASTLHLRLSWGLGAYGLLEFVIGSIRLEIAKSRDFTILEREWPNPAPTSAVSFSNLFIPTAAAEEEPEESTTLQVEDYPALIPDQERVFGPVTSAKGRVEVIRIEGNNYLFRIDPDGGSNGKARVTWVNMDDTAKAGNFDALLKAQEDQTLYNSNDISFCVSAVEGFGHVPFKYHPDVKLCALTVLSGNITPKGEDDFDLNETPRLYTIGFIVKDGRLTTSLPNPGIGVEWTMLHSVEMKGSTEELKSLVCCAPSSSLYLDQYDSPFIFVDETNVRQAAAIGSNIVTMQFCMKNPYTKPDLAGSTVKVNVENPVCSVARKGENTPYYAIQSGGKGQQLVLFSEKNGGVIAEAESIPYFCVQPGADEVGDVVFYLVKEKDPYGEELFHLFSASIQHYDENKTPNPVYMITDLDVRLPTTAFEVSKVGGTMFIHWLEAHRDTKNPSGTGYRIHAAIYDRQAGFSTADRVITQFSAPSGKTIRQIILTETGKGYYVLNEGDSGSSGSKTPGCSLYSFPLELVASPELYGVELKNDVISQGENEEVTIWIKNGGNTSITKFDLQENMIDLQADDKGALIQTVHCDILHPEKSYLHLEGDNSKYDVNGKTAAWRKPLSLDNVKQGYWEINRITRTYRGAGKQYDEKKEEKKRVESVEILPGSLAIFQTLTKIPPDWKGKKLLTFTLIGYTAAVNDLQTMAARCDGAENELLPEADLEISYALGSDGRMHPVSDSLVRASDGLVFADSVKPPETITLTHEADNLSVSHRVYRDPDGTRMLDIILTNDNVDGDSIRLYCEVYLDNSETPYYLDLPYVSQAMSDSYTHTISFPLSVLANGTDAKKARVVIRGIDIEETTLFDNSFEVDLNEDDSLRIIVQPQSRTALVGETITMTVKAAGGDPPYTYQWQVYMGASLGWRNIDGATEDTLTLENVSLGMNGWKYRCIVTDQNLDSITSDEAVLTVKKKLPPTGDDSRMLLMLLLAAFLLSGWFWLRSQQKKRER